MFTGIPNATRTAGVATLVVAAAIGLAGVTAPMAKCTAAKAAALLALPAPAHCGLMSVADVVGQLDRPRTVPNRHGLRGVFTKSESHRGDVYHFDGTSPEDIVLLLQKHRIESNLTTGNSMGTLEQDLAGGHKVIAALNAETIWNYPPGDGDRTTPDHAVVVTGVDTGTNIIHVNDSGTPTGRDEQIPMATFSQAWTTSDDLLIVTQETGN